MADLRRALRRHRAAELTIEPLIDAVAEFGTVVGEAVNKSYRIDNPRAVKFLKGYMTARVEMINATTREQVHAAIKGPDPRAAVREVFRQAREARAELIAETECLPGTTHVDGAVVRAAFRRRYDGDMVEIITENGRQITATPNHPMLTRRGWVGAGELAEFDDLVCDGRQQDRISDMDVKRGPSPISEIFDSLAAIRVSERVHSRAPDFHGDGRNGEVYVARPDRLLSIGCFAPLLEPLSNNIFAPAERVRAPFCPQCGRLLAINHRACFCAGSHLDAACLQSSHNAAAVKAILLREMLRGHVLIVSSQRSIVQIGPIVCRAAAFGVEQIAGSRASSILKSGLPERCVDEVMIHAEAAANCRPAQAAQIEFDRLRFSRVFRFSGHVYNLQTPFGYFSASGGFYTGNTVRASNFAAIDAGKWTAVLDRKRWATRQDGRVRPAHAAMHGQTVGWNDSFTAPNGAKAKYPGGFSDPALSARCRCAAVPVAPEAVEEFDRDPVELFDALRRPIEGRMKRAWVKVFDEQEAAVLAELE